MEAMVETLSKYQGNATWISQHYSDLKKKYKDEWVAVSNARVIDHDKDLSSLVDRLEKKYPKLYNQIAVEYIARKEIDLILG
ncbi:MAG: DUF5678 domain-containing protein [Euryarchaeota archaeon]|nr:DUF5678 domain-containing protein [Euryarchaeota archaeon]